MSNKTSNISSFFLVLFFVVSFSHLFASSEQIALGIPLIKAKTEIIDGILSVVISAPSHLHLTDSYTITSTDDSKGIKSDFLFADWRAIENPRLINFSISAKNTRDGIDCSIHEIQVFEEKGWFSDSLSRKEASQVIHIQNSMLDLEIKPEMRTARNVFPNSAVVRFGVFLLDK